jgi:hypothetical protein
MKPMMKRKMKGNNQKCQTFDLISNHLLIRLTKTYTTLNLFSKNRIMHSLP